METNAPAVESHAPTHSPLPWKCEAPDPVPLVIYDARGNTIVSTETIRGEEYRPAMTRRGLDAEMIVHRVNCHDDLVEALREAKDSLAYFDRSEFWKPEHRESLKTIRAALAKAEKLTPCSTP